MTESKSVPALNAQKAEQGKDYFLFDAVSIPEPGNDFFDMAYWRSQGALISTAQGRAAAAIFRYNDSDYVLRHFRRGGLVAKLSEDKYRWSGLEKTRAWCEWHLLAKMYQQGLPVPRPIAAHVRRKGVFYTADLVTLCLPNVQPLADVLMQQALSESEWQRLGMIIRRFHDAGIYHADLNARNILLDDQGRFFLIDFDKGEQRSVDASWQQSNIDRLERSFNKFKNREPCFYFDDQTMRWLNEGYK
ncbi:3-deoxy-D-manno-octulosonic acid kinase [Pseudomonadota bacterium]